MRGLRLMARLRRRRCPLCLLIGYMFALNLLVATALEARIAASAPLFTAVAASNCAPGEAADRQVPADQSGGSPACPSCDKLCPLGGCAPAGPLALSLAMMPRGADPVAACLLRSAEIMPAAALHPSDLSAQAPPRRRGSHA